MSAEQKPWFGKRCSNCESPINYAYKGLIVGWCGKCTDDLRGVFKDELRREIAKEGGPSAPTKSAGSGRLVLGVVLGLVLGFGGAVGVAVYSPETWGKIASLIPAPKKS